MENEIKEITKVLDMDHMESCPYIIIIIMVKDEAIKTLHYT